MGRIIYLTWPAGVMTGGIKMVFRHVEALRQAGFDARVATPNARPPAWFATTAPMIPVDQVARGTDALVFPANHAEYLRAFASWENPKVVFSQNNYEVTHGLGDRRDYRAFGIATLICPSHESVAYCRRRFPDHAVHLVPNPLDRELFRPRLPKVLQIALMPRKRPKEAEFIADLFRAENPQFRTLPWRVIEKQPEAQVAQILGESAVYLSLSRFESLGLSTLEAMSAGCVVAGFTGTGGREYATSKNGFWAAEDDCLACTEQLGHAVRLAAEGGAHGRAVTEAARLAADYYSWDRFRHELVACWRSLLDQTQTERGCPSRER